MQRENARAVSLAMKWLSVMLAAMPMAVAIPFIVSEVETTEAPRRNDWRLVHLLRVRERHEPLVKPTVEELIRIRRARAHARGLARFEEDAERCAAEHSQKPSKMAALYGAEAATPGSAFGDFEIDAVAGHHVDEPFQISSQSDAGGVYYVSALVADYDHRSCDPVDDPVAECKFYCADNVEADCKELHAQLDRAWGASPSRVWFDVARHVRASLREDVQCTLTFERLTSARRWIGWDAAIPLRAVGRGLKWLPAGAQCSTTSYSYPNVKECSWPVDAVGESLSSAKAVATVESGVVIRIEVSGEMSSGGTEQLQRMIHPFLKSRVYLNLEARETHFWLSAEPRN